MKAIIVASLFALSSTSFAATGWFSNIEEDQLNCEDIKYDRSFDQFECVSDKELTAVKNAKVGPPIELTNRIELSWDGAVEFGVLPDDSTSLAYTYRNKLLDRKTNKVVGYTIIEMYTNSEMETRVKLNLRFNSKGKLVHAKASSI